MSRRTAIVEEFDDDTDLPLPSRPLLNTGARGPLLEEINSDEDDLITSNEPTAGPASTSQFQPQPPQQPEKLLYELHPTQKTWMCIYPIYIDAKRPYKTGSRRISREKSVWWPLSKDIADVMQNLQLGAVHEVSKRHPKDWDNPGRVRVEWTRNGRPINPAIKTKKQLLEAIALQIQRLKPANTPKPPYTTATPNPPTPTPKPSAKSAKSKSKVSAPKPPKHQGGRRSPVPPTPHPPLASRVSPYSPALASGVLIETVKAGMNATEGAGAGGAGAPGSPAGAGMGKGKRKVVRVRG